VIDPIAPRYTCLQADRPLVKVSILGVTGIETVDAPLHPKDDKIGMKKVWLFLRLFIVTFPLLQLQRGPNVLIEQADAEQLAVADTVTLINWGNMTVKEKHVNASTKIVPNICSG
jgi:hypothetical protein